MQFLNNAICGCYKVLRMQNADIEERNNFQVSTKDCRGVGPSVDGSRFNRQHIITAHRQYSLRTSPLLDKHGEMCSRCTVAGRRTHTVHLAIHNTNSDSDGWMSRDVVKVLTLHRNIKHISASTATQTSSNPSERGESAQPAFAAEVCMRLRS